MKSHIFSITLILAGICCAGVARADASLDWTWTYNTTIASTDSYVGSGTFTTDATPDGSGNYTITGISGTWTNNIDTYTITELSDFFGSDNLVNAFNPQLTSNGLSFDDTSGESVNIFCDDPNVFTYTASDSNFNSDTQGTFTASVAVVPEPVTWCLLLVGLSLVVTLRSWIGSRRGTA